MCRSQLPAVRAVTGFFKVVGFGSNPAAWDTPAVMVLKWSC